MQFLALNSKLASFQSSSHGIQSATISFGANFVKIILDEVALEGLDGTTIPMLKHRLLSRNEYKPNLSEEFLLEILRGWMTKGKVACYKLPEPRPFVKPLDRFETVDEEGLVVESKEETVDAYPFEVVSENGVVGSCATFKARKQMKNLPDRIDESIVFVASQEERERALLGSLYDPLITKKFTPVQWCLLERIGRARNQGEVTVGKQSLKQTRISASDLFYHRKLLIKHGLITKQSFVLYLSPNIPNAIGLLFHVTRFYSEWKPKWLKLLYNLVVYLKSRPNGIGTYEELQATLGAEFGSHRKFFKHPEVSQFVKLNLHVAYSALYPDSDPKSWRSKNGVERKVRVIQLKDLNVNPNEVYADKAEDIDPDEEEDHVEEPDNSQWMPNRTIIFRAYKALDEAGPEGISHAKFSQVLGMDKLSTRSIIKYLERRGALDTFLMETGKQKTCMIVAQRFKNKRAQKQNVPKRFSTFHKESPLKNTVLTERQLSRINMIMEMINENDGIDDPSRIYRNVCIRESEDGVGVKMDRKSFKRLLERQSKEGKLKVMKIKVDVGEKAKEHSFVCLPHIQESDPRIMSALEMSKMKVEANLSVTDNESSSKDTSNVDEMSFNVKPSTPIKIIYDSKQGRSYGCKPKFIRARELQTFLFYITRCYTGKISNKAKVVESARKQGFQIGPDIEAELDSMEIYQEELDWRTFIPPLRNHSGLPKGWFLMSEALVRLPLSTFIQLVCLNYKVEGLDDYLQHPIRRHYLVKDLPTKIKQLLLHKRKYIASVYEDTQRLCYMGLAQLGKSTSKMEKEQSYAYVNSKVSLLDTRSSANGYHQIEDKEYPKMEYSLENMASLEKFWHDLHEFAMTTMLGQYGAMGGQQIVLEEMSKKPILQATLVQKTPEEAETCDSFDIPGDKRGAAGLDSSLFAHLKRNWSWLSRNDANAPLTKVLRPNETIEKNVPHKRGTKRKAPEPELNLGAGIPFPAKKPPKPAKKTRLIKSRDKVAKKPYYDEVDKEALKLMTSLRVEWTKEEDTFLLLSRVAGSYLCQNSISNSNQMVPYLLVRDELHAKMPEAAKNKTSRACQRRINYMVRNPATLSNVNLFLSEVRLDPEILAKFPIPERGVLSKEENENRLRTHFPPLLQLLIDKFQTRAVGSTEEINDLEMIPDNIEVLKSRFDICYPDHEISLRKVAFVDTQQDLEEIQKSVVSSIILSHLCCKEDKTNWAFYLYKIYQQYPDQLLKSALTRLRLAKIVSVHKSSNKKKLADTKVPLSSTPYQLSVTMMHSFLSRFQPELFPSAERFMKKVDENSSKSVSKYFSIPYESEGGGAASIVTMMALNCIKFRTHVPEQVVILDPNLSEQNEDYALMVNRYREIINEQRHPAKSIQEVLRKASPDDGTTQQKKKEKKDCKKKCKSSAAEKKPEDMEPLNEDVDSDEDVIFSEYNAEKGQIMVARSASRIALYMMKEELQENKVNLQHSQDYFVVASCKISLKLVDKIPELAQESDVMKSLHPIKSIPEECLFIDNLQGESRKLYDFIEAKASFGATALEIKDREPNALCYLKELLSLGAIYRVGVTMSRFVASKHSRPWLLHSFDAKRTEIRRLEESEAKRAKSAEVTCEKLDWNNIVMIDIAIRPWVKVNGQLNKKVVDHMLISILCYIMTNPGSTLYAICDHFQPALQPFHTRELVECLAQLECVSLKKFDNPEPVSLFSRQSATNLVDADLLDDERDIFVDPMIDCILKLSKFTRHHVSSRLFNCPCHY